MRNPLTDFEKKNVTYRKNHLYRMNDTLFFWWTLCFVCFLNFTEIDDAGYYQIFRLLEKKVFMIPLYILAEYVS